MNHDQQISIPYAKGSATSKAAAERIKGHAAKQRSIVLGFIQANGPVTDQEISIGLGIPGDSIRPRRGELAKMGLIEKIDEEGKTAANRHAARWRVRTQEENPNLFEVPGKNFERGRYAMGERSDLCRRACCFILFGVRSLIMGAVAQSAAGLTCRWRPPPFRQKFVEVSNENKKS